MKITNVKVTTVAVPDPPLRNSWGVHEPLAYRNLIEVETDDEITGLGETSGGSALASQIRGVLDRIKGDDPFAIERIRLLVRDPRVFAPIEVALLDIMGKATNRPVCEVLGGRFRDRVEFASYLFYKYEGDDDWGEVLTPETMLGLTKKFREKFGFRCHKIKGGVLPPDEEVESLRLIREAYPNDRLRIDPNAIWSVETSIRVAKALEPIGLEYLEDPTPGITGMALVAQKTHIPLSTNMVVTDFHHIPEAIRAGAVQVILGDHHGWGGLRAFQTLGVICQTFGLGLSQHSNNHLGITMAAMIHVAAAIPNLLFASDTHYPWQTEDIIKGGKLPFVDGHMSVPLGPGLGVELDQDQVARLAGNYAKRPSAGRDDVTEMRKRDPYWVPLKPRW